MKKNLLLGLGALVVIAAAAIGTGVIAQGPGGPGMPGGPGGQGQGGQFGMPMPPPPPMVVMKAGTKGVFVLAGTSLIKYDANLQQQGVLELIKPKAAPSESTGDENQQPMPPPPTPQGNMILGAGTDNVSLVLVLIGDKFFSIDAGTLAIKAKATLPKPAQLANQPDNNKPAGMRMPHIPPAVMELSGNTLYIQQAQQIIAISITDGKIVAQTALPKPALPGNQR